MSKSFLTRQALRWGISSVTLIMLALAMFLSLAWPGRATALPAEPTGVPSPTIHAIPSSDGTSVYIGAGRMGQLATSVYAYIEYQVGPTSYERSHTMNYDPGSGEYNHTFEGFFIAETTLEGSIRITTTATSILGSSAYVRHYVPGGNPVDLRSRYGLVNLHVSAGGLPADTYVLIMSTNIPPADPPPGHRLIGQAYSIRASHGLTESMKPTALRMSYNADWLAGGDPHALSLFAWDASKREWLDLGGDPSFDRQYLSQSIRRFTTYALMSTTTWRDAFSDLSGLAEWQGVRLAYGGKLELASGATSGWVTSVPITPTGGFASWGQLSYSGVITTGTALTVSVLDGRTGEVLLSNAPDGASLAAIDPLAHPSLRLRATLSADMPGQTPSLEEWTVSWTPAAMERRLYMPLLTAGAGGQRSKGAGETRKLGDRETERQGANPLVSLSPFHLVSLSPPHLVTPGCEPAPTPSIEWSAPVNVSDNAGHSLSPAVAVDAAGTLHAVWYDNSSGNLDVFYASKGTGGWDWSAPVNVSNTPGGSYWPAIAVDVQGNVHVAWDDSTGGRDILYAMKPAGGAGWTPPENISQSPGTARFAALATDVVGNVHAVWNDDTSGNAEIYYAMRPAGTANWTVPTVIASTPGTSWAPAIAVDPSGSVHVAWHDFTPGPTEIYYAMKPAGGPWSSPVNVSRTTGASYFPTLAVDSSGMVHLAWYDAIVADYGVPFEVLYAQKSPDGGWMPYVNLSRGTGSAEMPTLAVGPGDALHVAWDTTGEPRALLYVHRPAAEMGWTAPVTVTAISSGAQYPAPALAAGPAETVHLAWGDFGPLSRDIFHSTAAPPPVPEDHVLVLDEDGYAVSGACVYRNGVPTVATDDSGVYVPPALAVSDTLAALQLVAEQPTVRQGHATPDSGGANWAYRIYLTSVDVADDGSTHPHVVTQMGQQRLVVKKTNPLILYNLLVSIEWDATITYTQQISQALRWASDYLYDVSDGQMALGHVAIHDNASHWADADVQISAHNRVRPYAYVGGLTAEDRSQIIRIGRGWDRWADSQKPWNASDGFRTLIHEFGHYGLYLYDEYFEYVFEDGVLVGEQQSHCTGPEIQRPPTDDATNASIMYYQYRASELAARGVPGLWSDWCELTAQWQLNGESDWETVTRYYTDTVGLGRWQIVTPANRGAVMPGPDGFPHDVFPFPYIEVHNEGPDSPWRYLTVLGTDGEPYRGALVVLDTRRGGQWVTIDQGFTDATGEIVILGAAEDDKVRAMSMGGGLSGEVVVNGSTAYTLSLGWAGGLRVAAQGVNPYASLIPGSDGRTLSLALRGVRPGGALYALLVPPGSTTPQRTSLASSADSEAYTGTVSFAAPAMGIGSVHVRGLGPLGEMVAVDSDFSLLTVDVTEEEDLYTADGNVWLHLDRESAGTGNVYAVLMPSGAVPQPLPPGRRVVGNAYSIQFSGARPRLERPGVLKLFYHPGLVGNPAGLGIYRWDVGTATWKPLGGELDEGQRSVSVSFDRFGIYALLAAEGPVERVYLPMVVR